ncbi:MAG: ribose 5-phosphate isomerase B [Clostridia bacterium]|nr:ribose 5-phosphate isomerase B [Clostridia bacterium]
MIVLGADHGGYKFKEEIKKYLDENGIQYEDIGTFSEERTDFPIMAKEVCEKIQKGEADKGILICRSGYGMAIVANKYKGIYCAPVYSEETAKFCRAHNNTNVLALGADYMDKNEAIRCLRVWLATNFEGGRYEQRLNMIKDIERENMK